MLCWHVEQDADKLAIIRLEEIRVADHGFNDVPWLASETAQCLHVLRKPPSTLPGLRNQDVQRPELSVRHLFEGSARKRKLDVVLEPIQAG